MQSKMWTGFLTLAGLALACLVASCGDNQAAGDARAPEDGDPGGLPPPPTLGAQLDRVGRAAIVPTLIGAFDAPAVQTAKRDAYARASDPATWLSTTLQTNITVERELLSTLATWDGLDFGSPLINKGCNNAILYDGPPPGGDSYKKAATLLADDQLYVDTGKASCNLYLALELQFISNLSFLHTTCGGRTPGYDAIDMTYSLWIAGRDGLDDAAMQSPRIRDGVSPHAGVSDTVFPFLAPPH
jgi:hypothetical protein